MLGSKISRPWGFEKRYQDCLSHPVTPSQEGSCVDNILKDVSWRWNYEKYCADNSPSTGANETPPPSSSRISRSDGKASRQDKAGDLNQNRKRKSNIEGTEDNDEPGSTKQARRGTKPDQESRLLACPYFKRSPERFCKSPICVGPGWRTVYRLKEHLFRRHAPPPFQCRRCFSPFNSIDDLDTHQRASKPCKIREKTEKHDQFDGEKEQQLRKRTKGLANQSEREKWVEVYRILFPNEEVPSPYYDYDITEGLKLAEFFQQEFPSLVKSELEANLTHLDQETVDSILAICLRSESEVHKRWTFSRTATGSSTRSRNTEPLLATSSAVELRLGAKDCDKAGNDDSSQEMAAATVDREPSSFTGEYLFEARSNFPSSTTSQSQIGPQEDLDSSYSSEHLFGELGTTYSYGGPSFDYMAGTLSEEPVPYDLLHSDSIIHTEKIERSHNE